MFLVPDYDVRELDQELIMKDLLGIVSLHGKIRNPLRVDRTPGATVQWFSGVLYLKDRNFYKVNCDIIDVWRYKYNVSYEVAKYQIYSRYVLKIKGHALRRGSGDGVVFSKAVTSREQSRRSLNLIEGDWKEVHSDFWYLYGLSREEVESIGGLTGRIYPVEAVIPYPGKVIRPNVAFGMDFIKDGKITAQKYYAPYSETKWLSSAGVNDFYFQHDFRHNVCLLGSSFKDCATLYPHLNVSFRAGQSESMLGDLEWVKAFDVVVISYDLDEAGNKWSLTHWQRLEEEWPGRSFIYNLKPREDEKFTWKDWAELYTQDHLLFESNLSDLRGDIVAFKKSVTYHKLQNREGW